MQNAQKQIVTLKTPRTRFSSCYENPHAKRTKTDRNVVNAPYKVCDVHENPYAKRTKNKSEC